MLEKYSDTKTTLPASAPPKRIFAIDSGSPISSVALAWDGEVLTREFPVGDSSKFLLPALDELLAKVGGRLSELEGLAALLGPGSFTGLRVGLASILGLHQALGIPAGTATTFEALAWQAQRRSSSNEAGMILAAIDALRGDRFVQEFDGVTLEPLGEPEIKSDEAIIEIAQLGTATVIGFGLQPLRALAKQANDLGAKRHALDLLEASALAPHLSATATDIDFPWDALELTRPLYLRPPMATLPAPRA